MRDDSSVPSPGARPLTARSLVASLLLGVSPPRLPSRHLVQAGELFGIEEGTVRVALSRMAAAGEVVRRDGDYELAGPLLERQARQAQGRSPRTRRWRGDWVEAVVVGGPRSASARNELRQAARSLRLAELREGVWLRPDNLERGRLPAAERVLTSQCLVLTARPPDDATLVGRLWDLEAWAAAADSLRAEMAAYVSRLEAGDADALAPAFLVAATVVRHLVADPLLPAALLPASWPGAALREEYDRYERAFRRLWRAELRSRSA